MTLFKQIALMLSIFLLIILATVLTLNFQSTNQSIQERLYEDAKNTASSLSLSLGTANGDLSIMSTMINANFDSGNYHHISLIDVDNKTLYERKSERGTIDVPQWFLDTVIMTAPVASANVSAGWSQVGILNVQSNISYAYEALYQILLHLLVSFSIIATISLATLYAVLIAILKPLRKVQVQAKAVLKNEFIIQDKIPYTKEFKDVVLGMNSMVHKAKAMFEKGNEELKKQQELEYIDPITKLKNRKYLIHKLPEYLKIDASAKSGINMMISLTGVIEANTRIGHKEVDNLFLKIAEIFKAHASNYENSIVARLNGTEFSILLPACEAKDAMELAQGICNAVNNDIMTCGLDAKETFISIGVYHYNYMQRIGQVLSFADYALSQAKFNEQNIHLELSEEVAEVMGKDAWKEIINNALSSNTFAFTAWTVVDSKAHKIAHNVLSISLKVDDGVTYSYGQFMASANQLGLGSNIYQNVINMMFKTPAKKLTGSTCSFRLSYEYLTISETYDELSALFKYHALVLPFRLIIELPDKLVRKNSKQVKLYKALFEKYNIEIGIYEFIGESIDYNYLQDLRPVYIKAEASFFVSQNNPTLSALRLITDTLGISLIATSVMDMATLSKLQEKGIYMIQGRATEMIELR